MAHLRRLFTSCLRSIHHSWCLVAAMVGFLVGCFWSALSGQYIYLGTSVLIAALSAIILSLLIPTRLSAIFALALGFMLAECRLAPDLIALGQWRTLVGQTLTISGTLTEDPSLTSGQIALRLGNLQIHPATDAPDPPPSRPVENSVDNPVENSGEGTSTPTSLPGTLYVTLSGSDGLATDDLLRSDHLTLTGTLQAGFGTFAATIYRPTVTGWSRASPGDLAAQFKLWFTGLVQTYISRPASDLGLSYLLGYKAGLSDELSDTLQIVGMTHVVVASGSHLSILVGAARKLFGRLSKFASLLFSLLLVGAFLVVVGFTPSMLRAACVTVLTAVFLLYRSRCAEKSPPHRRRAKAGASGRMPPVSRPPGYRFWLWLPRRYICPPPPAESPPALFPARQTSFSGSRSAPAGPAVPGRRSPP